MSGGISNSKYVMSESIIISGVGVGELVKFVTRNR